MSPPPHYEDNCNECVLHVGCTIVFVSSRIKQSLVNGWMLYQVSNISFNIEHTNESHKAIYSHESIKP